MAAVAAVVLLGLAGGCARRTGVEEPGALLEEGWRQYRLGEYGLAVDAFDRLLAEIPAGSPLRAQALYGLATVWSLRMPVGSQDKERARALFAQVAGEEADGTLAPWALLAEARLLHVVPVGQEPDYAAVREAYTRVAERYPDHPAGHEALVHRAATRVATVDAGQAREAERSLLAFVAAYPRSGMVSAAYSVLAAAYQVMNRPGDRLLAMERALETVVVDPAAPGRENSGDYWSIATLAEFEVGDFDAARRYYRKLLEEYPHDIRAFGAEQALARMDAFEERVRAGGRGGQP